MKHSQMEWEAAGLPVLLDYLQHPCILPPINAL